MHHNSVRLSELIFIIVVYFDFMIFMSSLCCGVCRLALSTLSRRGKVWAALLLGNLRGARRLAKASCQMLSDAVRCFQTSNLGGNRLFLGSSSSWLLAGHRQGWSETNN